MPLASDKAGKQSFLESLYRAVTFLSVRMRKSWEGDIGYHGYTFHISTVQTKDILELFIKEIFLFRIN